ncbi:alpha-N-arabinofuranosidase [Sphingomonas guangdongensis]|uniref:Alpha-N-arabinofuranosidase n=1 Tax=Sphingomonas guangdongensis TaxID=1141890 RepID=A0A285QZS9_9SPHN|nr:glycoside hydrolase family 43 protein [Sphingomonas guangdongensis]SOB87405.1 alpha-N-arabinofuranosidase [Sphingomonas guangdongensis]
MMLPLLLASASFDWFDYRGADPVDRAVQVRPSEYRNPILQGFYPDPSITRVGDDYYLVHSTFSYFPGIPVWHSRDLVTWRQIGNAIDRPDQLDFKNLGLSRGVFAPAIQHHAGTFYILNTCVDCGDNFLVTASNPAGPWSDPIWLPDLRGAIDPSLFVDADGSAWIVNNGPPEGTPRYEGHRAIWIQRFDLKTNKTFGPRKVLVDGGVDPASKPIWIEGPHLIAKDGWYYLICAEGGTAINHSQVVLRSRRPDGPFTPGPNPILTQRDLPADRPYPVTSAGHADFVQTPDGKWWASFLAVRPYAGDFYNTGRETFLLPVDWSGEWPRILPAKTPIPLALARPNLPRDTRPAPPTSGAFGYREEFDAAKLGPEWLMMRNPRESWYTLAGGALTLKPRAVGLGDNGNPSFLARRQQHTNATVTTRVRFDAAKGRAGLAALQNDDHWFAIAVATTPKGRVVRLIARGGEQEPKAGRIVAEAPAPGTAPIELRGEAAGSTYRFAWRTAGAWRTLGPAQDGTLLSTAKAGGFVGAVFGVFAEDR